MANELEILTENAAGTSWVDLIPGAVSTGYQAQNTNIEANRNGIDASYVRYDSGTDEIVIDPSGPIDVNGVPFSVKSEIRLANPGAGTWYLKVIAGADDTLKSIEITSSMGAWVAAKNGLYDAGERVLNWVFDGNNNKVSKLLTLDMYSGGDNTFTGDNKFTGNNEINVSKITGLSYGDIGTYTIAGSTSFGVATEYLPGITVNGNTLIASNDTGIANSSSLAMIATVPHISLSQSQNLSLTGVWMLMCRVRRGGDSNFTPVGLFIRIE